MSSLNEGGDSFDDSVDPRVHVELECLNAATKEINRLEVELDEAKIQLRSILNESSQKIEVYSKQLADSIDSSIPYYEARLQVKVISRENERLAATFEKANSAHAAAKEMVFLAEEGLKTEGRTFDHAWQEMLNHATMRVNEEESARTECEARLNDSAMLYEQAVETVQLLQKSLKKSISKSRPYFGLRVHYSQLLEERKMKVKTLEKQVAQTKLKYADTLKNLERISDEIHQSRKWKYNTKKLKREVGSIEKEDGCSSRTSTMKEASNERQEKATPISSCSLPDTDCWSQWSDLTPSGDHWMSDAAEAAQGGLTDSRSPDPQLALADEPSDNDSSLNGLPYSNSDTLSNSRKSDSMLEEMCAILDVVNSTSNIIHHQTDSTKQYRLLASCWPQQSTQHSQWTEIKLSSSGEEDFLKMESNAFTNSHEDLDIPYTPLNEIETEYSKESVCTEDNHREMNKEMASPSSDTSLTDKSLLTWLTTNKKQLVEQAPATPSKMSNLRRQSLDVLWNNATGERMKEIISQGMLKLNMSTVSERRNSDAVNTNEQVADEESIEDGNQNDGSAPRQFGLQFFSRKSRIDDDGGTPTRRKHVSPSPLERTLSFLNTEEDIALPKLPSLDTLSEEQLSALIQVQDLAEQYRDFF